MKKCRYCGTPQSNERHTCVDCGRPLGKPLSEEEAATVERTIDSRINALADRTDAFHVSNRDKILGILGIAVFTAAVVLFCLTATEQNHIRDAYNEAMNAAIQEIQAGADPSEVFDFSYSYSTNFDPPSQPTRAEIIHQCVTGSGTAVLFLFASVPMMLFPRLIWYLDTWKLRVFYNADPTPSEFVAVLRRGFMYLAYAIGIGSFAYALFLYL